MRLFFAAMLPEEIQRALGHVRPALDWLPVRGNWSAVANLHLTLKFLGEVPDDRIVEILSQVRQSLPKNGPVKLVPHGIEFFPPSGDVRVLAAGFEGEIEKISAIQAALESTCETLGFTREPRPFVAHATLARFRDGLRSRHRERVLQSAGDLRKAGEFQIREIQLMQSTLTGRGSEYAVAARLPLL